MELGREGVVGKVGTWRRRGLKFGVEKVVVVWKCMGYWL